MTDYVTTTNPWYLATGDTTYAEFVAKVHALDHDDLARAAINDHLNDFASRYADFDQADADPRGHGKRIPYVGWYWRMADFAAGHVTIADCGDFIGVCENNKWDYPDRAMTAEEVDMFIDFLWRADHQAGKGGVLSDTEAACNAVLSECWDWFQNLSMDDAR